MSERLSDQMTPKIQIMSSTLANQIAAGEVIERPASVVKELVENAIDAGSSKIEVFVEEAGLNRIQVIDNGEGIASEEVLSAFERHATSKLISNDDLFRIRTLGFRGEALPSIASVSKVTVETAQSNKPGRRLVLEGGEVVEDSAAKSRQGLSVTVDELFYNTPARLKYVRTLKTELSHITDAINRFALAHPEIAFKLASDGSVMIRTSGNKEQIQAIAGVYGVETARKMKGINQESFDFNLDGFISLPEVTRASNNYITLIVNGRVIKNYALNKAIVEGYGSTLMVGRYPVAVIRITMDPLLLDVNVHPTKQQVRISNERELGQLISQTIKERLSQENRIPNALENVHKPQSRKQTDKKVKPEQTRFQFDQRASDSYSTHSSEGVLEDDQRFTMREEVGLNKAENWAEEAEESNLKEDSQPGSTTGLENHEEPIVRTAMKIDSISQTHSPFPELEYIGQMHGTYLFAQNEKGLYIIDQHAAQERIKYEYYKATISEHGTDLQELLVPLVLDYPTDEALVIRENMDKLQEASIHLEDFGQNSFVLRNHPNWMIAGQVEETIKEMIDFFLAHKSLTVAKFREATAIMMSCKRSIKANHYLSPQEGMQLLVDLKRTQNPYNCPHGRPVLVSFTTNDMEKMFKRIQDPH